MSSWKFIGGNKRARKSLAAAVDAIKKNDAGEIAIYDSNNGRMYSREGELLLPLTLAQSIASSLAIAIGLNSGSLSVDEKSHILDLVDAAGDPLRALVGSLLKNDGGSDGSSEHGVGQ